MLEKVISGGQTGVDRIGLEVARAVGIPTGGTAPKRFRTEIGEDLSLASFGLVECNSWAYSERTLRNVKDADATVLFGNMNSTGSQNTIIFCVHQNKPYLTNPRADELARFIQVNNIKVLNVAGNRGSKLNDQQKKIIAQTLTDALQQLIPSTKPNLG